MASVNARFAATLSGLPGSAVNPLAGAAAGFVLATLGYAAASVEAFRGRLDALCPRLVEAWTQVVPPWLRTAVLPAWRGIQALFVLGVAAVVVLLAVNASRIASLYADLEPGWIGGLVLTLAPFTLAYWLGVVTVASLGAHFHYIFYLAAYGLLLLLGAGLFGVNAFLFTRGNSVFDGIVFVAAWACALPARASVRPAKAPNVRIAPHPVPMARPEAAALPDFWHVTAPASMPPSRLPRLHQNPWHFPAWWKAPHGRTSQMWSTQHQTDP